MYLPWLCNNSRLGLEALNYWFETQLVLVPMVHESILIIYVIYSGAETSMRTKSLHSSGPENCCMADCITKIHAAEVNETGKKGNFSPFWNIEPVQAVCNMHEKHKYISIFLTVWVLLYVLQTNFPFQNQEGYRSPFLMIKFKKFSKRVVIQVSQIKLLCEWVLLHF